jgi:hypothetical protein
LDGRIIVRAIFASPWHPPQPSLPSMLDVAAVPFRPPLHHYAGVQMFQGPSPLSKSFVAHRATSTTIAEGASPHREWSRPPSRFMLLILHPATLQIPDIYKANVAFCSTILEL